MKNLYLITFITLISCAESLEIDHPHESRIHLDAIFYADQPLPKMEVKQTFQGNGAGIYEVPKNAIFLEDAEVQLLWNGTEVAVEELESGIYQGISSDSAQMGDIFEITVTHTGRTVSAVATVPRFPTDQIRFDLFTNQPFTYTTYTTYDSLREEVPVWVSRPFIRMTIPFVPAFFAIQTYSGQIDEVYDLYRQSVSGINHINSFVANDFAGLDTLTFFEEYYTYFRDDEHPTDNIAQTEIDYRLVIAEPIYAKYHENTSSLLVPVTVTNVVGGVGLFMGAIEVNTSAVVSVPVEYGE